MEESVSKERNKKSKVKVTFPNRTSICYQNPIDTLLHVLKNLSSEQLQEIKLESKGRRLITQEVNPEDDKYKEDLGNGWWYINKFVNADNKFIQLKEIDRCLGLGLKVEISPDFEPTDFKEKTPKKRTKQKLFITLPNNFVLFGDSSVEVFRKFVKTVDPEDIARKNIELRGQPLISTSNTNGKRFELAPYRWLLEPKSTKEAADMAFLISRFLNISCKIEIK